LKWHAKYLEKTHPKRLSRKLVQGVQSALDALLAKRSLISGENQQDYDTVLQELSAAVPPVDFIERIHVKDLADFCGTRIDGVMGRVLVKNLESVERIDALIASQQGRRLVVMREIETRHGILERRSAARQSALIET
jgi:hypothetical protein